MSRSGTRTAKSEGTTAGGPPTDGGSLPDGSSRDGRPTGSPPSGGSWVPKTRPTLRDVALRAGVSPTTASRVLNGKMIEVSDSTRVRVLSAAREMRYRPNALAVGLRKRATRVIGLIIPDILDSYFHILARAVTDTALEEGFVTIVCNTDRVPARERMILDLLADRRVDGIIFAGGGVNDDAHLRDELWAECPVVAVGPHRLTFPTVRVDNAGAMQAAVRHLASQGAQRIACLGGQPDWLIHQERLQGYLAGLESVGLERNEALIWTGDFGYDSGYVATTRALAAGTAFDGIVSFNDNAAIGAIEALRTSGRRVPDDVLIVGCDDIPVARLMRPTLSSISFPLRELGVAATRTLVSMIAGRSAARRQDFPYEVVVRESSIRAVEDPMREEFSFPKGA